MGTRARIWLTMILLGYPFLAIGASTCSFAAGEASQCYFPSRALRVADLRVTGLLVAASYSESSLIRYGGYALVASPLSCAAGFVWILSIKTRARRDDIADTEKV